MSLLHRSSMQHICKHNDLIEVFFLITLGCGPDGALVLAGAFRAAEAGLANVAMGTG
jgi:hypothetical protein